MRRGEMWTISGGSDVAGKPRPAVTVQDDNVVVPTSNTVCALTPNETGAASLRRPAASTERDGLRSPCRLVVDKSTTGPKAKVGSQIGRLDDKAVMRLNRATVVLLGPASWPRPSRP